MAVLWFVGAGLSDERGLSERAHEVLSSAKEVFAEEYTSVLAAGSFDRLAGRLHRDISRLDRRAVEEGNRILSALDRGGPVALIVPGDPFTATTHVALRVACERAGHTWRYLPNASIVTAAAGFLGLMAYRFGRVVSLPFADPKFTPTSPVEMIGRNRGAGLHSLVLLDLVPSEGRFLLAPEALSILLERDPDHLAIPLDTSIGVVARIGSDEAGAWFGRPDQLSTQEFGPPMHALIVPAPTLHFEEEAAVARFRVK